MTKTEKKRQINLRLKIINHYLDVSSNAAATCRYFGISRQTFYKWINRYNKYGEIGLYDRSNKPKTSPRATSKEVVSKVLYLRQNYHFGAGRISYYLERYHQIKIATSTVHEILKR
jgi:transposase